MYGSRGLNEVIVNTPSKHTIIPMHTEREKAHLATEIFQKFAPYIDKMNRQFLLMKMLLDSYAQSVDAFQDVAESKRDQIVSFMALFNDFIKSQAENHAELMECYNFLLTKTTGLVEEYKVAAGQQD